MIAQKGPVAPDQLGMPAPQVSPLPPADQNLLANPEVAKALSNPEIIRAFSNPEVVKAFALSPPKKVVGGSGPGEAGIQQAGPPSSQAGPAPPTSRGPDIANSAAVPPELSKLPSGFSIFPVVAPVSGGGSAGPELTVPACTPHSTQTAYYQSAAPSYVSSVPHRELATIPMAAWPGMASWHVQPVSVRSPAKLEPGEGKHWDTAAPYFRTSFS